MLVLSYTKQQDNSIVCTTFWNPKSDSAWEIFDTNFPMSYILSDRWIKVNI